ncbi:MAG: hypothetical protein J6Q80_04285 [Lentisphaeria bacterium]|nr:hypothetical protein [Lentisphaeria bacterium]
MECFLAASLPTLLFGQPSPLSVAEFDAMASEYLSAEKLAALTSFSFPVPEKDPENCRECHRIFAEARRFEHTLRSRIAKIRSERLERETAVADPEEFFSEIEYTLNAAMSCKDPMEREMLIDRVRWDFLEDLSLGHMIDFEALCIYRLKLQILAPYTGRTPEEGTPRFEMALESIISAARENK